MSTVRVHRESSNEARRKRQGVAAAKFPQWGADDKYGHDGHYWIGSCRGSCKRGPSHPFVIPEPAGGREHQGATTSAVRRKTN